MIHWSWGVFVPVFITLVILIYRSKNDKHVGDYSFDLETPFWVIILIAFTLIWGGIFWW